MEITLKEERCKSREGRQTECRKARVSGHSAVWQ